MGRHGGEGGVSCLQIRSKNRRRAGSQEVSAAEPGPSSAKPLVGEGRAARSSSYLWGFLAGSVALIGAMITIICLAPPPALDRSRSASVLVLAADGSLLRGFLSADGKWRLPIEPEAVDPLYRQMLVAAEDRRFVRHFGVDPLAAMRAMGQLAMHGHVVSGASTLTMQVARLLEPHPRSLVA